MKRRAFLKSAASAACAATGMRELMALPSFDGGAQPSKERVPIIHCTDLFQPPDDPDDDVDLATLFALSEFDIRAIILDQGKMQRVMPGEVPVTQMMALTGRKVPYARGLAVSLRYPKDKGENQPSWSLSGRDLILRVLRESDSKVVINVTGSLRDVAAAFNRDEDLFRSRVYGIYVNAGRSDPSDTEWNTIMDAQAYIRIMTSDLPIYWCPCFGDDARFRAFQTYWKFRQSDVYESLPVPLQNFFLYALGSRGLRCNDVACEDPLRYLKRDPDSDLKKEQWAMTRNMWSTASMIHAAGRKIFRHDDSWAACEAPIAGFTPSPIFEFVPASVMIDEDLKATLKIGGGKGNFKVFRILDGANYEKAMTSTLHRLLSEMPVAI